MVSSVASRVASTCTGMGQPVCQPPIAGKPGACASRRARQRWWWRKIRRVRRASGATRRGPRRGNSPPRLRAIGGAAEDADLGGQGAAAGDDALPPDLVAGAETGGRDPLSGLVHDPGPPVQDQDVAALGAVRQHEPAGLEVDREEHAVAGVEGGGVRAVGVGHAARRRYPTVACHHGSLRLVRLPCWQGGSASHVPAEKPDLAWTWRPGRRGSTLTVTKTRLTSAGRDG